MIHRLLLTLPVAILFIVTAVVFLAARAPQTFAYHWTSPVALAPASDLREYGAAAHRGHAWNMLWIDDSSQQLMYTRTPSANLVSASTVVDAGDLDTPALLPWGTQDVGAWVHNYNGSTELKLGVFGAGDNPRIYRVLGGSHPIEHPFLFRIDQRRLGIVFSWQLHGNFDLYLAVLQPAHPGAVQLHRLTRARYYSFYPRAVVDGRGGIDVIHLESCCTQQGYNVELDRFSTEGRRLRPTTRILAIRYPNQAPTPAAWAEDIQSDGQGGAYGSVAGADSAWMFRLDRGGRVVARSGAIPTNGQAPTSLALAAGARGATLFWQQPYDLGSFIQSERFSPALRQVAPERIEYLSGEQGNPHAVMDGRTANVVWQMSSVTGAAYFEQSDSHSAMPPTIAERLGLGIGDPWQNVIVLLVGALGLATLATSVNILAVALFALLGAGCIRLLSKMPGRWTLYACFLTLVLYTVFVVPGTGPVLFLTSIPALGLAAVPFGLLAAAGSMAFVTWVGHTALRRIDDLYRAAIMAFLGIYFFAFLEAAVFIQQRLGYI